jgi:MFS transporter, putative metabolite:H+ symporter
VEHHFVNATSPNSTRGLWLLIIVSSLGYFVDVFDLLLFSVVRTKSLLDLGVAEADTLSVGLRLLNWQMAGMLVGGFLCGVIGDKRGRLSVLFGSIIVYSAANMANALAQTVGQYEALRFLTGLGLAGELGAGVALVTECMTIKHRGLGTMLVAAVGVLGAILAAWVGKHYSWRTAYIVGGVMGLILLLMRIGLYESGLYETVKQSGVARGSLLLLFRTRERVGRFAKCVLAGLPTYFIVGILITLSPEFGHAFNLNPAPNAGTAVSVSYAGLTLGSLFFSSLSQLQHSRRHALLSSLAVCFTSILVYLFWAPGDLDGFYYRCFYCGFGTGYWALIVTNAAEQFGTNLRATVTTAVPNLIRGAQIPISYAFVLAKAGIGIINGAALVGVVCVVIAMAAVYLSQETFHRSLDFLETDG